MGLNLFSFINSCYSQHLSPHSVPKFLDILWQNIFRFNIAFSLMYPLPLLCLHCLRFLAFWWHDLLWDSCCVSKFFICNLSWFGFSFLILFLLSGHELFYSFYFTGCVSLYFSLGDSLISSQDFDDFHKGYIKDFVLCFCCFNSQDL